MFIRSKSVLTGVLASVLMLGSPLPAAAQSDGITGLSLKAGVTFPNFDSADVDFENRTGWHLGLAFGGNRSGTLGLQAELNWLRRRAHNPLTATGFHIDYLQVPVMLRLNLGSPSPSGLNIFGVVGPAVEVKIADEIEGFTIDDGFEGADVGLVFGGGFEVARFIAEARWEKGLRRVNKNFTDFTEIKSQSFTVLVGVRFR